MSEAQRSRWFQFSLRRLLIGFTALAVGFYLLFIRPTEVATRFVNEINQGDLGQLMSLRNQLEADDWRFSGKYANYQQVAIRAELRPRAWTDMLSLHREVVINGSYPKGAKGAAVQEEIGYRVLVGANGLRIKP